jgi:hypothetical protein
VICVNGGQRKHVEGTWSASLEWLVERLAPRFPSLRFAEVRYRVKSWQQLDSCIEDAHEAIAAVAAPRTLPRLLDGRRGLAVVAGEPSVVGVLGSRPGCPSACPWPACAASAPGRARPTRPGVTGRAGRRAEQLARRVRTRTRARRRG